MLNMKIVDILKISSPGFLSFSIRAILLAQYIAKKIGFVSNIFTFFKGVKI